MTKRNIVLIGLSGCGKSTFAPLLAGALQMDCVDMDAEIVKEAGMPISEIFASQGEKAFRDMETETARRCAAMDGVIISTGGGVILRPENMEALSKTGLVVFLDRSPDDIVGEDLSDRPLVAADQQKIYRLYEQRIGLYRQYGEITVQNRGGIADVAQTLITRITEDPSWKN